MTLARHTRRFDRTRYYLEIAALYVVLLIVAAVVVGLLAAMPR